MDIVGDFLPVGIDNHAIVETEVEYDGNSGAHPEASDSKIKLENTDQGDRYAEHPVTTNGAD